MQVERTDFVSVPVTDLERSTSWYRDTLDATWRTSATPDGNVLMLHRRYAPRD